jgi:FKBP12-rapamycin complex-associated protein
MVLTPKDDMKTWLHFADLCRTSDRLNLAEKTLTALVGSNTMDPDVSHDWRL